MTTEFIAGELTAHNAGLQRPSEEVPEDAEWRSARPVPATTYFDGLCDDLRSLELIPMPGHPKATLDLWEIWPGGKVHPSEQKWVDVSQQPSTDNRSHASHWTDC